MASFTLLVRPDGRAILTTERRLEALELDRLRSLVDSWRTDDPPSILLIGHTSVVRIADVELDLDQPDGRAGSGSGVPQ